MTPASGIYKNRNKLIEFLATLTVKPDVIVLQEVKLKASSDDIFPIEGYSVAASALCEAKRANGCIIYAKTGLTTFSRRLRLSAVGSSRRRAHRRPKEAERLKMDNLLQAKVAKEHAAARRIVVAGDLNVTMAELHKGKAGGDLWGRSHCDIPSPISRIEALCTDFNLEDTFRVSRPGLKVSRDT
ncbi:hypothetical protein TL16_g09657 [Triparma laevis f. inornata]|uniref:Endonuclease/exonuclease/phosphatase domain-containing protein n=1 Tax=Triparma laevis f. inornata TaxID=1714386 RepID=A0A9W7B9G5_9STRA|nr:hypothetical protein TL16_g09657 [Triparma laevis f. inornata]